MILKSSALFSVTYFVTALNTNTLRKVTSGCELKYLALQEILLSDIIVIEIDYISLSFLLIHIFVKLKLESCT